MSTRTSTRLALGAAAIALIAAAGGYGIARLTPSAAPAPAAAPAQGKPILYWYDPMIPMERHTGPGKSSMNMDLIPKYAEDDPGGRGVRIDPAKVQNLGVRLATVTRGSLPGDLTATGIIDFNGRDVAVVQAKAAGFVQRVYGRAPGDLVGAGAPLADLLIPEWSGAQGEYLAVRRSGDLPLIRAARERLALLGMSASLIASIETTGRARNIVTVTTPTGGVIKTLTVRNGMSVVAGETLAEVDGLSRVWLNAAVPEAMTGQLRLGQTASATLAAYPGETFTGRVAAILPQAEAASRTLTVRVELPNPRGRLRPGMFAAVQFGGSLHPALLAPSEALIRTGTRTLVMVSQPGGRYVPAAVTTGRQAQGQTEILSGLSEGEQIVASGQFLLDSEASLSGVRPRPAATAAPPMAAPASASTPSPAPARRPRALLESKGRIEALSAGSITISHEPVAAISWPAMTMTFQLDPPGLAKGLKVGDRVAFGFEQRPAGPVVRRLMPTAGAQ
jgi:Cu(I)/Ag(I) efflux system membrane fusion protein